jgi:chromosome segregation ATPase
VIPPRLPVQAEEDGLVKKWRQLDDVWMKRVGKVRDELRGTERERGRLSQVFTRLVGAMLGFALTEGRLRDELADLEAQTPSATGTLGAGKLLERLARIEEEVQHLSGNLEDADHKAREEEARETQEAAWRRRVEDAQRTLPDRRAALASARATRAELAAQLEGITGLLESVDEKAKKDLKARRAKLYDDRANLDKTIRRLEQEIADLERRESEPFVFKPPAAPAKRTTSGTRFVPAASAPPHTNLVPDEALPVVGRLRSSRGQRYLVIETWEEVASGEADATRLKAHLVAPEDA